VEEDEQCRSKRHRSGLSFFFFFFFFVCGGSINKGCNFPPMKRQVVLRGGVQQKSANQKNQKKTTKNTKLREKIKEINLKTRKITLPDPETFFSFFFFPFFFFL
jgi:hypothetical protein